MVYLSKTDETIETFFLLFSMLSIHSPNWKIKSIHECIDGIWYTYRVGCLSRNKSGNKNVIFKRSDKEEITICSVIKSIQIIYIANEIDRKINHKTASLSTRMSELSEIFM